MEGGMQMGYVLVYGEDSPAVFDGKEWHSVLDTDKEWSAMNDQISQQYYAIIEHSKKNPEYAMLAQHIMGGVAV
jgi:hypothetical protein